MNKEKLRGEKLRENAIQRKNNGVWFEIERSRWMYQSKKSMMKLVQKTSDYQSLADYSKRMNIQSEKWDGRNNLQQPTGK